MKPTRPRGRPPLDRSGPSVSITLKLPAKQYEELYAKAARERVSLAEVVRRQLHKPD